MKPVSVFCSILQQPRSLSTGEPANSEPSRVPPSNKQEKQCHNVKIIDPLKNLLLYGIL